MIALLQEEGTEGILRQWAARVQQQQQHYELALHTAEISRKPMRRSVRMHVIMPHLRASWTEMCQLEWVWCGLSVPPTFGFS